MWIKHGRCFHCLSFIRLLVVMIVLVKVCDACSRRRNPSPQRSPTNQPPIQKKTTSIVGTNSSITASKVNTTCQVKNYDICYTTNIQNLTIETIKRRLEALKTSGEFAVLFHGNGEKRHLFLKWLQENKTECSDIQGYMIIIQRDCDNISNFEVTRLNQTSATKHCNQAQNCSDSRYLVETLTANATSKPLEQLSSTESSSTQTKGSKSTNSEEMTESHTRKPSTVATTTVVTGKPSTTTVVTEKPSATTVVTGKPSTAGRSDGDEVSTTAIVISVTVVVLLVIVLVITALCYKRRSARKCYEKKMQNSVERTAGPINGDVYTVVNPSAEKTKDEKGENNDMVYIELSHRKTEKSADKDCEVRSSQQEDYADISHILTPGESTYENATPQCDQDYANVVVLQ